MSVSADRSDPAEKLRLALTWVPAGDVKQAAFRELDGLLAALDREAAAIKEQLESEDELATELAEARTLLQAAEARVDTLRDALREALPFVEAFARSGDDPAANGLVPRIAAALGSAGKKAA